MTRTTPAPDARVRLIVVASALAAHHFGTKSQAGTQVRIDDVMFVLSGQVGAWDKWSRLPAAEQTRIARLLRVRDADLANVNVVRSVLRNAPPESRPELTIPDSQLETLGVRIGRPLATFVDDALDAIPARRPRAGGAPTPASDGDYSAPLFRAGANGLSTVTNIHYTLSLEFAPPTEPIDIGEPAVADSLEVPLAELRSIADKLDESYGTTFRRASLDKVFSNLDALPANRVTDAWSLSAGPLQVLHAPTGFGKSVLTELAACWAVQTGRVMTILVAANSGVIKTAKAISDNLERLGLHGRAIALTSPNSAQRAAETAVAGDSSPSGPGLWAMKELAYGCALTVAAQAPAVDRWEPGEEPCTNLRPDSTGAASHPESCPWLATCGKFRNVRAACTEPIVVTTYANWLDGRIQVPVLLNGHRTEGLSVEELLLRRSHFVLIDEVDEFQATMIKRQARTLVLAHRRPTDTPLRLVSAELHRAPGHLSGTVRNDARKATNLLLDLAEGYVGHLVDGDFQRLPAKRRRNDTLHDRWMLPQKWDARLTARLFDVSDDESPTAEQFDAFNSLLEPDALNQYPEWLGPVRSALSMLTVNDGTDRFDEARSLILSALEARSLRRITTDFERAEVTDQLTRRAIFTKLRELLTRFIYLSPHLTSAGVDSARDISDQLRQYKAWRAAPLGPLGRTLFAFAESFDPDRPDDTSLRVNAFGGDPHEYVRSLGELTALAHSGTRRCIVGLSATSYLPGAPHHHVFAEPTWWVPDSLTGGFELIASSVTDENQEFVRISGTQGPARRDALVKLGDLLWVKQLAPELARLAADPETVGRQRLLLATTSYDGATDLAKGILKHVPGDQVVVATRPDEPFTARQWKQLPADQLERFGRDVDGSVLIAPLARAARGINMADEHGRSSLGSVWLVVRPVPIIEEPAEILAHVHSTAKAAMTPNPDPSAELDRIRQIAGAKLDRIFGSIPYFSTLPSDVRLAVTAENLIGLIQLAGRARRGGTRGRIHLVDNAFLDPRGNSDLPRLIRELRQSWEWAPGRPLELIHELYGDSIKEIFNFADERADATDDEYDTDE